MLEEIKISADKLNKNFIMYFLPFRNNFFRKNK